MLSLSGMVVANAAPFAYTFPRNNLGHQVGRDSNLDTKSVGFGNPTDRKKFCGKVYITHCSGTVSVIDTATHTVTDTVSVGSLPQAFGLFIGPLPASLNGHVTDKNTGNPINQALVIALQSPTQMKTKTNDSGTYEIKALSSGDWLVLCWKRDYQFALQKVTLAAGET